MDNELQMLIVKQVADLVAERYVFPEQGSQIADRLRHPLAAQPFAENLDPAAFAQALTQELYAMSHDSHLWIKYDPQEATQSVDQEAIRAYHFERARRKNFGFTQVARL